MLYAFFIPLTQNTYFMLVYGQDVALYEYSNIIILHAGEDAVRPAWWCFFGFWCRLQAEVVFGLCKIQWQSGTSSANLGKRDIVLLLPPPPYRQYAHIPLPTHAAGRLNAQRIDCRNTMLPRLLTSSSTYGIALSC